MRRAADRAGSVLAVTMVLLFILTSLGLLFWRVTRDVRHDASMAYHRLQASAALENALVESLGLFLARVNTPHIRYDRPPGQARATPRAGARAAEVTGGNDAALKRFLERNEGARSMQAKVVAAESG